LLFLVAGSERKMVKVACKLFWLNCENTATIYCCAASHAEVVADTLATVVCHSAQHHY
jgi:hypothetical protein